MGLSYYRPGKRFVGLFPIHQALTDLGSQIVGITGGGVGNVLPQASSKAAAIVSHASEVIGGAKDLKEALSVKALPGDKKAPATKAKLASNEVYIKFAYLPEEGMTQIGRGEISFKALYPIVLERLSAEV